MSYIQNNLLPGEKVIYKAKIHFAIFLPSLFLIGFSILLAYVIIPPTSQVNNGTVYLSPFWCIPAFIFLAGTLASIRAAFERNSTEFGVTNQRIIAKTGFIRRNTLELLLSKTESVSVDQDVLGRLLGFGTITVIGTGGTKETISPVAKPIYVRQVINRVIEKSI